MMLEVAFHEPGAQDREKELWWKSDVCFQMWETNRHVGLTSFQDTQEEKPDFFACHFRQKSCQF